MSKCDLNAQSWVNNPYEWQEHEEDHVAEQFIELLNQVKPILQLCFCGAVVGGVFTMWWFS